MQLLRLLLLLLILALIIYIIGFFQLSKTYYGPNLIPSRIKPPTTLELIVDDLKKALKDLKETPAILRGGRRPP